MQQEINRFIEHVKEASKNPEFVHHKWFVEYHLEIVEKIAFELCDIYEQADREFVRLLVWLHDYGKILDFDNQYEKTLSAGRNKLLQLGFDKETVDLAIESIEIMDRKEWSELETATIEIQIISSADAASHRTGPFMSLWWYENSGKDFRELMQDNINKSDKDWHRKMVLPEARKFCEQRRNFILEQNGQLPKSFIAGEKI